MSFTVRLVPQNWLFEATPSDSLLLAAERGGMRMPSSCRNGTCRTCLCRVASGVVRHRIEWPGLSSDELADGYILPCVAVAEGDLVLEARAMPRVPGQSPRVDAPPAEPA